MPSQFTQVVGEKQYYQQEILNDTILSVSWQVDLAGPDLAGIDMQPTIAKARFGSDVPGNFVVTCVVSLASGQVRKGQARINVVEEIV